MSIALAVLAALSWGFSDFVAQAAARRLGSIRSFYLAQWSGLVLILPLVLFVPPSAPPSANALFAMVGFGLAASVGYLLLYHALAHGNLAVVSPVASAYAAVTVALSLLTGGVLPVSLLASLGVVVLGIVLAASGRGGRGRQGAGEAALAALALGTAADLLGRSVRAVGPFLPILTLRLTALFLALPFAVRGGGRPWVSALRSSWRLVLPVSLLDLLGFLAFSVSLRLGPTPVATVIASLFAVVTVLLGGFVLRERLRQRQWLGVGLTLTGIALVTWLAPHP
jgi:drug/metabolite transporter (DMT)-like permease